MTLRAAARLAVLAAVPAFVAAQAAPSPPRSPQDLLRAARALALSGDLADIDAVGGKLGVRFVPAPAPPSAGRDTVSFRLQRYDRRLFDPRHGPADYYRQQPAGKSWQRIGIMLPLAVRRTCVTVADFVAVFGAGARRREATDNGGFGYIWQTRQGNEISVSGFFGHARCMGDLTLQQNVDRLD
jgi:hypothetical protein